MNIYNKFKEIAKKFPDHKAVTEDSGTTLSYKKLLELVDKYSKMIDNIPQSCGVIHLPKSIDLIATQLALNSKKMPFLTLEYGQTSRLHQAISQVLPSHVFSCKNSELIISIYQKYKKYDDDLAYIVFSSGSTGYPKEIHMKDAPVLSVVEQQANITSFDSNSTFLWLLNSAFDASLSDIYMTLLSGGHLVITDKKPNQIKSCFELIEKYNVTHTDIPPVVFSLWLKQMQKKKTHLKHIVFGGELANENIVKQMLSYVRLYNAYGPTETTICSSMIEVDEDWSYQNVGKPLNGVLYKIIEDELHIGGEHCSLGYSDPKLNNKFYTENNTHWFQTGDIFKEENGNYFYQGRKDRQIKLNGQLICPEEIEYNAKKFGAENAQVILQQNKLHLYYSGDLQISLFKENTVSWMHPHFYHPIEITGNLNQNWKLKIQN